MSQKHTLDKLNSMNREELITIILTMQGQLDALNENIEKLIEQVRIANQNRFGRSTETMKSIDGQLSFFDEAENQADPKAQLDPCQLPGLSVSDCWTFTEKKEEYHGYIQH